MTADVVKLRTPYRTTKCGHCKCPVRTQFSDDKESYCSAEHALASSQSEHAAPEEPIIDKPD